MSLLSPPRQHPVSTARSRSSAAAARYLSVRKDSQFSVLLKIPEFMQILLNSYLSDRNSKYKVFYMNLYQKNA
jgi:recombinational DNA repair protein (RecF pathway)